MSTRIRRFSAFCPNPPQTIDWRQNEVLQAILNDPACRDRRCRLLVIPFTYEFSPVVLSYSLRQRWPDSLLAIDRRFRRGRLPDYVLDLAPGSTPVSSIVLPDVSREVATFALPNGKTARLTKRID